MNCLVTGVVSSGVVMGVQALFNFTPLPKSKSQIFTGDTYKHKHTDISEVTTTIF